MERYRFYSDGSAYFVTFSIVEWLPVFVSEAACSIVSESLNFCHANKGLRVDSYVIMPSHLHAIVFHETMNSKLLEKTLADFRKFTGRRIGDYCESHMPKCFSQTFHDSAGNDRERRIWQPSKHPEQIETESFCGVKRDYLHANPCRKGLVRRAVDWRYSSAQTWLSEAAEPNEVILTGLQW